MSSLIRCIRSRHLGDGEGEKKNGVVMMDGSERWLEAAYDT